jgi:methionyl-tRNA formyltransferase
VIVVAFGQILPKEFLEIPPLGCINLHFSLCQSIAALLRCTGIMDGNPDRSHTMYMSEGPMREISFCSGTALSDY